MVTKLDDLPTRVVTRAIHRMRRGDVTAEHELWTLLYDALRARAALLLRGDAQATTLAPTDVLHHAYGKLPATTLSACSDRWHVVRLATRAMRQVLIDEARRRHRRPATTCWTSEHFDVLAAGGFLSGDDRLDIALAIDSLARVDRIAAEVVTLRHYGGLEMREIALSLGKGERTVYLLWHRARAWLRHWLTRHDPITRQGPRAIDDGDADAASTDHCASRS